MSSALAHAGYSYNKETLVWIRQNYGGIAYSDGDEVERRIASIIGNATDLGILSDELRPHCTDWPSIYHLSGTRANILRPFESELRGDILEIGAGCGAITRFLGECGGNVLALEGSPRRASIARARTRDLDNVTVVCDKFDDFSCDQKFDVVTLIGVLEYANLFTAGEHPTLVMLERVRNFLKPSGKLIIAIENQLGLKYFAGAPEDHVGIPMYGIEARYRNDQPRTFGRKELDGLIRNAGFKSTDFLAPFPDYKLPVSIVTEYGFSCDAFDVAALVWNSAHRDPQMPSLSNFSMELAYPVLIANGLSMETANSFLVVASPAGMKRVPPEILAYHYSTDRVSEYCKETRFVRSARGAIEVCYRRLIAAPERAGRLPMLQFSLRESDEYVSGSLLVQEFPRIVVHDGWTFTQVAAFIRRYIALLAQLGVFPDGSSQLASAHVELAGRFFDAIPQNIVIRADGTPTLIDKEWQYEMPIEFGYLLLRAILSLINATTRFGRPMSQPVRMTRQQFINAVFAEIGLQLKETDYARYAAIEADIQQQVTGQPAALFTDWGQHKLLPMQTLVQALKEMEVEIDHLRYIIGEREEAFMSVINSRSWRLTKPLRWVGRVLRGEVATAIDPFQKMLAKRKNRQVPIAAAQTRSAVLAASSYQADGDIVVRSPITPTHSVSVIVPVYRGIDMTRRCIEAAMPGVLAMEGAKLLAINDCSPDHGMQAMLESLLGIWPEHFEVLENPVNLGFVGTINRGMAHFPSQDVVLLNSDVIVPADWLKRLQAEAYSHPHVATVTPFSNNATICSFPNFLEDNPLAFNLDVHTIDAVFRQSTFSCISAPTGVGFCMFIRRACLNQIGYLNAEKFGRGYGEENDLCQRAIKAGWLNILTPNIYCFHEGGVSFSTDKQALVDRAMHVIDELYPNYHADVQAFIQRDPARLMRCERYLQLIASLSIPKVLHISHGLGGGVDQHIKELAEYLGQCVVNLVLSPQQVPGLVSLSLGAHQSADKIILTMPNDYEKLRHLLDQIGVCAVHYHHVINLDPVLLKLGQDLYASTLLTVHDFYLLNANPTLTGEDGRFPGKYVENLHNPLYPIPLGMTASKWREKFKPLVEQADCVIFPSNAARVLFGDMYQLQHAIVAPHVEPHRNVKQLPKQPEKKIHYVIGVLGALSREKGADVLEKLAEMAKNQDACFSFVLIGYVYRPLSAVKTTGPYKNEDLPALIEKLSVDIILFPAQWPETYSYTLSTALTTGLPIIAPYLGAFPERLSGRANTTLFDYTKPIDELYRHIFEFINELEVGNTVMATAFRDDLSLPGFYDRDYLCIVGKKLKPAEVSHKSFNLDETNILRGQLNQAGWRKSILRVLWYLNTRPVLRRFSLAVPYSLKRSIKRSLSRSPMHDVVDNP